MSYARMDFVDDWQGGLRAHEPEDKVCLLYFAKVGGRGGFGTCGSVLKGPRAYNW